MNELTRLMIEYRRCLKVIWNGFLVSDGKWDVRDYFYKAAVELFKAIVLSNLLDEDIDIDDIEIKPDYDGGKQPIFFIRVLIQNSDNILISREKTFRDTEPMPAELNVNACEFRYVGLHDPYELSFREFKHVEAEIVASPIHSQVGIRVLIPFEQATFERVSST